MSITKDGKWEGFIYRIYDKINNKNYIGQTITTIDERWRQHQLKAQRGSKNSFHRKLNEIGIENFEISYVDSIICDTRSEMVDKLNDLEIKYIKEFDSFRNGYNSNTGGSGDKSHVKTKIICIETGVEFDSVVQASREMNICRTTIFSVLRGECIAANGYTFRKIINGEIQHFERKKQPKGMGEKKVICLETGKIFNSIAQIERELNISKSQVSRTCKGKQKTAMGFTFRYFENGEIVPPIDKKFENKPKYICIETKEIFETLSEITKAKGINISTLSMMINGGYGKISTNKGLTFRKIINGEIIEPSNSSPNGNKLQRTKIVSKKRIINIDTGIIYETIAKASKELNLTPDAIRNIISGKALKDYGFNLREIDDLDNIIEPTVQKAMDTRKRKKIRCINNNKIYLSIKEA
ncbi:MAG: GIY-YIG nuclease family protein, partial [Romboutsia sp.]|nr:GIY-YIG nuclease family protein [Romboutsia sp.]